MTGGKSRSATERIECGIARATTLIAPRWRKALTRKRATPVIEYEKSTSCSSASSLSLTGSVSIDLTAVSVSSGVSGSSSAMGSSSPSTRVMGGTSTLRCRSDPPSATSVQSALSMSNTSPASVAPARAVRPVRAMTDECPSSPDDGSTVGLRSGRQVRELEEVADRDDRIAVGELHALGGVPAAVGVEVGVRVVADQADCVSTTIRLPSSPSELPFARTSASLRM